MVPDDPPRSALRAASPQTREVGRQADTAALREFDWPCQDPLACGGATDRPSVSNSSFGTGPVELTLVIDQKDGSSNDEAAEAAQVRGITNITNWHGTC